MPRLSRWGSKRVRIASAEAFDYDLRLASYSRPVMYCLMPSEDEAQADLQTKRTRWAFTSSSRS